MPKMQAGPGGMADSTFAEQGTNTLICSATLTPLTAVLSGRLMCDTYYASRELIRHKNYRLGELAQSQLSETRPDLDEVCI
jgi:DNA polymerase alpha subunit A